MTITRKDEERFLNTEERELVAQTHHPEIDGLSDTDLASLRKLLRERRDRSTDIARRQRREMRGKASPHGAVAAKANDGSKRKTSVLAQAMRRLNSETARRERKGARAQLVSNMRNALAMKQAASEAKRPASRTAGKGMRSVPNRKAEQIADPREAGRVSQFVKKAQAKRDA